MKKKPAPDRVRHGPDEELIRDYAAHLWEQSGRVPGHDLDNWLEAKACVAANIPRHHSHRRLHRHLTEPEPGEPCRTALEAHNLTG
ncbi:MAG: DUF2934 domain-containing protein [Verrucomicrobia bacterium]|nr:DUF2934 domain-containing protein [Verrucomicrobiota bacterium]